MKTLIKYTDKLPSQDAIDELRSLIPYLEISFEKYDDAIQTVHNPYFNKTEVSWPWLKALFTSDIDAKVLLTNRKTLESVGVTGYLGLYNLDTDAKHEFYISNEKAKDPRATANGFTTNFAWIYCHELLHGWWARKTGDVTRVNEVHDWEREGTLKQYISQMVSDHQELQKKVSLLQTILELTKTLFNLKKKTSRLIHPLGTVRRVTQAYGVSDSVLYPLSKHHIGTDYGCKDGTALLAPLDGEVVTVGKSSILGNNCEYRYTHNGKQYTERWLHLQAIPTPGKYKQGHVVAFTGNTGFSTGAHLHHEVWYNEVNLKKINPSNWSILTIDPEVHYK